MRRAALALAVALLAGCAGATRYAPPAVVYDFGAPLASLSANGGWPGLALLVRSPPWFDSLNVDFRLAYDDPLVLREYAGSRWAGAPGVLLAQRLGQLLGAANADSGGGVAACRLRVDVQEFAQRFDTPQRSFGVLQANVSFFDGQRRPLGERQFLVEMAAARPDAPGGAQALVAASNELGRRVADWLDALDGKATRDCRSPQLRAP